MNSHTSAPPPALRLLEKQVRGRASPSSPTPARPAWWLRWLSWTALPRR